MDLWKGQPLPIQRKRAEELRIFTMGQPLGPTAPVCGLNRFWSPSQFEL
jgi:lipoate synthase